MTLDLKQYLANLEYVRCGACGADECQVFSKSSRWDMSITAVICRRCGLLYLNPRPAKELYQQLNRADYRHAVVGTDEPSNALFVRQREHALRVIIPFMKQHGQLQAPQTLLDIGCLQGGTMAGWLSRWPHLQVEGIEPVEKAGEYARRYVGASVTTGLFEDFVPQKKYDVVIFAQALNHTLDPRGNLEKIRGLLTGQGLLFISLYDAVSTLLNRPLSQMVELTHPYMFSRETIQYLLTRAGFEIIGFEDNLLDAATLRRKDIPLLSFPRIKVLARPATHPLADPAPPDYHHILGRIERNIAFYERYQRDIKRWQAPTLWRRAYQYATRKVVGG